MQHDAQLYVKKLNADYRLPHASLTHLSAEERGRLKQHPNPSKAHRSMAAWVKLRHILAEIIDCPPADVLFMRDKNGRPSLHPHHGIPRKQLDFSLGHCSYGFAVFLAFQYDVGVDIQQFSPRQNQCFNQIFGEAHIDEAKKQQAPQTLWTRMEAFGKMQGEGLGYGMKRLYNIAKNPSTAPIPCHFLNLYAEQNTSISICLSELPENLLIYNDDKQSTTHRLRALKNTDDQLNHSAQFL